MRWRIGIISLVVLALLSPTTGAQGQLLETDSQDVHHMKQMWLKWDWLVERRIAKHEQLLRERRERIRAAEQAAAEAEAEAQEAASTPSYSYSGGVLSEGQVASYARGAGFPESLISTMVAIAWRESRFNPGAVNSSSGACGLWQMYPCPGSMALNPATNASMAYAKYVGAGYSLSPWGY